jgi:hypothetical protein
VSVVTIGSAMLHLALFIGGMVVARLLRHRDRRAALLIMLGFACVLLGDLISFGYAFMLSAVLSGPPSPEGLRLVGLIVVVVFRLSELAGLALILLGLLRVVRSRGPVAPGMGRG